MVWRSMSTAWSIGESVLRWRRDLHYPEEFPVRLMSSFVSQRYPRDWVAGKYTWRVDALARPDDARPEPPYIILNPTRASDKHWILYVVRSGSKVLVYTLVFHDNESTLREIAPIQRKWGAVTQIQRCVGFGPTVTARDSGLLVIDAMRRLVEDGDIVPETMRAVPRTAIEIERHIRHTMSHRGTAWPEPPPVRPASLTAPRIGKRARTLSGTTTPPVRPRTRSARGRRDTP